MAPLLGARSGCRAAWLKRFDTAQDHYLVRLNMNSQATTLPLIEPWQTPRPIDPATRIGHVHLKVADLDRSLAFYCGVLGFELKQRYGDQAAFIAAGGYHHHIGLNTWQSRGGKPPSPGTTGLSTSRSCTRRARHWPMP